jgi:N-acetyl-gamma-glutamyl-phosphate reductase
VSGKAVEVGIVGATGYAGQELLRILLGHPRVRITYLAASGKSDPNAVLRHFGKLPVPVVAFDAPACAGACRTVFLGLPHDASMECVPGLLKAGLRVLDLSAAFRLKDARFYESHYKFTHNATALLKTAVYGLPELYHDKLKGARLIAVPGCYPTSALIPLAPLARKGWIQGKVIVNTTSGITGAGREAKPDLMYCEVNENITPYGLFTHRHTPEIAQELAKAAGKPVPVLFTPHYVPMNRGILTTIYLTLKTGVTRRDVLNALRSFYATSIFVRILDEGMPDTRGVRMTNFCDVGTAVRGRDAILVSAIDNLVKGAAGEAVQAFNIAHGFPEDTALKTLAGAP